MRLQEVRDGGSRLKARDLVGLLLSHGARAWRASQPVTTIRLRAEFAPRMRRRPDPLSLIPAAECRLPARR